MMAAIVSRKQGNKSRKFFAYNKPVGGAIFGRQRSGEGIEAAYYLIDTKIERDANNTYEKRGGLQKALYCLKLFGLMTLRTVVRTYIVPFSRHLKTTLTV